MSVSSTGHRRIDERSLALHHAYVEKLRRQPELLQTAFDNLNRWSEKAGRSQPYLDEWRRILEGPFEQLLVLMELDDERMAALRQSSPFAGLLEPAERWAIYEKYRNPADGGTFDAL